MKTINNIYKKHEKHFQDKDNKNFIQSDYDGIFYDFTELLDEIDFEVDKQLAQYFDMSKSQNRAKAKRISEIIMKAKWYMNTQDRTMRDVKKYRLLINMPWLRKGMIITWSDGEVNKESGTLANDISRYLSRLYRTDQSEWKLYFEELKQPEKQRCYCSCHALDNFGWDQKTRKCEHCENQEIEIAEEITEPLVYTNLIENRKLIIELQETVNKLLEK